MVIFSYFWLLGKGIMIFWFLYVFFFSVVINRRITFKFYYKKSENRRIYCKFFSTHCNNVDTTLIKRFSFILFEYLKLEYLFRYLKLIE